MTETNPQENHIDVEVSSIDEAPGVSDNTPRTEQAPVLKPLDLTQKGPSIMSNPNKIAVVLMIVAIGAGVATGFGIHRLAAKSPKSLSQAPISTVPSDGIKNGDIFGSNNESDFKDTATGYLEKGGINGEGSHKLLRPGGESQTVYLTSSVTDLDKFVGMQIQVWGETFKAQSAGWLMDVGRVKVINTQGQKPTED